MLELHVKLQQLSPNAEATIVALEQASDSDNIRVSQSIVPRAMRNLGLKSDGESCFRLSDRCLLCENRCCGSHTAVHCALNAGRFTMISADIGVWAFFNFG